MNIAVLSPDNRGTGVTSISLLLGMAIANRNINTVVTSLSAQRSGLRDYIGTLTKGAESESGMKDIYKLIAAGTMEAKDISNYCLKRGIDILPRTEDLAADEVKQVIEFISKSMIDGRRTAAIVDVDIPDMRNREAVGAEIKAADVIVIVLTQGANHLRTFKENRANMAKAFSNKKVFVVVNRYDAFAGTLKDIWKQSGMKYGDNWFEVRYNKCVPFMTAKCLITQATKAMSDVGDTDIMTLKADIDRIALAITKISK